jgi:hypothetical protein
MIPSLLGPLQYTPSPAVEEHVSANLTALVLVMRTIESTDRISRWRGQIIHVCGILAVNLRDRGMDERGTDVAWRSHLQAQLKEVFSLLGEQCPDVRSVSAQGIGWGQADLQTEYPSLVKTDHNVFASLVPVL